MLSGQEAEKCQTKISKGICTGRSSIGLSILLSRSTVEKFPLLNYFRRSKTGQTLEIANIDAKKVVDRQTDRNFLLHDLQLTWLKETKILNLALKHLLEVVYIQGTKMTNFIYV